MTGLSIAEVLSKTEAELKPFIEIGEEVYKQNQQQQELLLDLLDYQLASIAHLINNAYFKPEKFKNFLYLKHEQQQTKPLNELSQAIDAEIQLKANQLAEDIKKRKAKKFIENVNNGK